MTQQMLSLCDQFEVFVLFRVTDSFAESKTRRLHCFASKYGLFVPDTLPKPSTDSVTGTGPQPVAWES